MGDLIVFRASSKERSREKDADVASAEILFFTGVRYYRYEDAAPVTPTRKRRERTSRVKPVLPATVKPALQATVELHA